MDGKFMALQIVWRSPELRLAKKPLVVQIVADAYGALYAVLTPDEMKVFELIVHRAA